MTSESKPYRPSFRRRLGSFANDLPWYMAGGIGHLLWGFQVLDEKNIPEKGPYILAVNETGLASMLVSGYFSIVMLHKILEQNPLGTTTYMQEELWSFSYFRKALGTGENKVGSGMGGKYLALVPHSAGVWALNLLEGYHSLKQGGIVVLNPQGEATWSGRPVPCHHSAAWLSLRTGAPIIPCLSTIGAYDLWPRWQTMPSRKGDLKLAVGKPFTLADRPLDHVTDADVERGTARVSEEFDRVAYGRSGGIAGWVGPILRNGKPVTEPITLRPPAKPLTPVPPEILALPRGKRGIAQLLWQCPVCRADEALTFRHPRFKKHTLRCHACGTVWEWQHVVDKDFRMKVVQGPEELIGLEMGASTWYEHMKQNFVPKPISVSGVELLPGEQVYLEKGDVPFVPYKPSTLFDGWTGREPPKAQPRDKREYADWAAVGEGRLLLTSHRLLWQGPQGELDFLWPSVTAVYQFVADILGIRYGTALYRFDLNNALMLRWLTHAGVMAQKAAEVDGHKVTVSNY